MGACASAEEHGIDLVDDNILMGSRTTSPASRDSMCQVANDALKGVSLKFEKQTEKTGRQIQLTPEPPQPQPKAQLERVFSRYADDGMADDKEAWDAGGDTADPDVERLFSRHADVGGDVAAVKAEIQEENAASTNPFAGEQKEEVEEPNPDAPTNPFDSPESPASMAPSDVVSDATSINDANITEADPENKEEEDGEAEDVVGEMIEERKSRGLSRHQIKRPSVNALLDIKKVGSHKELFQEAVDQDIKPEEIVSQRNSQASKGEEVVDGGANALAEVNKLVSILNGPKADDAKEAAEDANDES